MKPIETKTADEIIDEELSALEHMMRQLKIEYDRFFNGGLKLPPWMLRAKVDRMIQKYVDKAMRSYAQRFRYNTIVARYHAYRELWGRNMRTQEEGAAPGLAARTQPNVRVQERLVARARVSNPSENPEQLREIYRQFVSYRERNGKTTKPVSFDKFVRGVAGQAVQLRNSSGCDDIELRLVVENDQVQLKARPAE